MSSNSANNLYIPARCVTIFPCRFSPLPSRIRNTGVYLIPAFFLFFFYQLLFRLLHLVEHLENANVKAGIFSISHSLFCFCCGFHLFFSTGPACPVNAFSCASQQADQLNNTRIDTIPSSSFGHHAEGHTFVLSASLFLSLSFFPRFLFYIIANTLRLFCWLTLSGVLTWYSCWSRGSNNMFRLSHYVPPANEVDYVSRWFFPLAVISFLLIVKWFPHS